MEDLTIQLPRIELTPAGRGRVGAEARPDHLRRRRDRRPAQPDHGRVTVIGRTAGCDIVIPESRVSRRHAIIRRTAAGVDEFELVDLDSTNGTFVDGERVTQMVLQRGHKVAIGGRILKFEMVDKTDIAYQSRIVQMIHLDELTGLLTKRSLFRALEMELIRTERYKHPLSVLMMDLDHFKKVNDTLRPPGRVALPRGGRRADPRVDAGDRRQRPLRRRGVRVVPARDRHGGGDDRRGADAGDDGEADRFKYDATQYQVPHLDRDCDVPVSTA